MRKLLVLFFLLIQYNASLAAWYGTGWAYRAKITTQNSKIDADLTDYPIYVNLGDISAGHGFWTHVLSSGNDIRITKSDGTTEVPFEIVKINTTTKVGELHFKAAGTLSGTTNADYYMYYGNGDASAYAASATYGSQNVWESNYKLVSHLQNSSADSTVNGNTGTDTSISYATAGKIGNGATADAITDMVSYADNSSLDISPDMTVSFWANITAGTNQLGVASKDGGAGQMSWIINTNSNSGANTADWRISSDGTGDAVADKLYRAGPTVFDASWNMLHMAFSANSLLVYKNASDSTASTSKTWDGTTNTIFNSTAAVRLFKTVGGINAATGTVDEFRIAKAKRSATWISTEYNNQSSSSTFYTIATEEAQPAATSSSGLGFGGFY